MKIHRTSLMMLAACSLLLPASDAMAQPSADCLSGDYCDGCDGYSGRYGARGNGSRGDSLLLSWLRGGNRGRGQRGPYWAAGSNGGRHGYGCNPHYGPCRLGCWLNAHSPYHRCTYPPDHGFAPPAQRPIYPTPALYTNMFAGQNGAGAVADPGYRHPMVYTPTDTTQLGYYYQQTPYWQRRAGMIPPVPHPDAWHTPDTGVVFTGWQDAGYPSALPGCQPGEVQGQGGGIIEGESSAPTESYESTPAETEPVPMHESTPPYAPEPAPPSSEEDAPAPPVSAPAAQADQPALIPVPRR